MNKIYWTKNNDPKKFGMKNKMKRLKKVKKQDELYKRAMKFFGMSATELKNKMSDDIFRLTDFECTSAHLCERFMVELYRAHEKTKWTRLKEK